MDMITKTRRRFMSLMMLVIAMIITAALVAVYWLTYSSQEANNRSRLNSFEEITVTEDGTVSLGKGDVDAVVVERIAPDIGIHFSMLTNNRGEIITVFSKVETSAQDLYQTAADIAWSGENYGKVELDGRVWQYSVSPAVTSIVQEDDEPQIIEADEIYQIRFVDITESGQTLRTLTATLFVIGISLLLFFFFFSLFFSKRAVAPLREVLKKQQQFVADASHELKTPVSIIKANCSVLYANEEQTIASQKEWLNNIGTGADRMTALIQNLLAMSKIEGTDNDLIPAEIHLCKVIEESLDTMDLRIKKKSLTIETSYGNDLIWSDPDRVRQVMYVVLDNAIKYANDSGRIRIFVAQQKKWCCLSVFNTGVGIKSEDLEKIFDRFYRAEGARAQDDGYGLGLSIAQTVMRQLGGSITAESILDQNATFTLYFPKK